MQPKPKAAPFCPAYVRHVLLLLMVCTALPALGNPAAVNSSSSGPHKGPTGMGDSNPSSPAPMNMTAPTTANINTSADDALLASIALRIRRQNAAIVRFWSEHGLDEEHGGVHGALDRQGNPTSPTAKSAVQQARHLWTFSTLKEAGMHGSDASARAITSSCFDFLQSHMRGATCTTNSSSNGGDVRDLYAFTVVRNGSQALACGPNLYAHMFVILAMARYGEVYGVPAAVQQALSTFRAIDAVLHDTTHGGYDEARSRPQLDAAPKTMAAQMHALEALTQLYRTTGDSTACARVVELLTLMSSNVISPQGYAYSAMYGDWVPIAERSGRVDYGHDLQLSWLLHESLQTLQSKPCPGGATLPAEQVLRVAESLARISAAQGFDARGGGFYTTGTFSVERGAMPPPPFAAALSGTDTDKIWWVQAEAMLGLWKLYRRTADPVYIHQLNATLVWVERCQSDQQYGEWYWTVTDACKLPSQALVVGAVTGFGEDRYPPDIKGNIWKASYHTGRATTYLSQWLKSDAGV